MSLPSFIGRLQKPQAIKDANTIMRRLTKRLSTEGALSEGNREELNALSRLVTIRDYHDYTTCSAWPAFYQACQTLATRLRSSTPLSSRPYQPSAHFTLLSLATAILLSTNPSFQEIAHIAEWPDDAGAHKGWILSDFLIKATYLTSAELDTFWATLSSNSRAALSTLLVNSAGATMRPWPTHLPFSWALQGLAGDAQLAKKDRLVEQLSHPQLEAMLTTIPEDSIPWSAVYAHQVVARLHLGYPDSLVAIFLSSPEPLVRRYTLKILDPSQLVNFLPTLTLDALDWDALFSSLRRINREHPATWLSLPSPILAKLLASPNKSVRELVISHLPARSSHTPKR